MFLTQPCRRISRAGEAAEKSSEIKATISRVCSPHVQRVYGVFGRHSATRRICMRLQTVKPRPKEVKRLMKDDMRGLKLGTWDIVIELVT